MRFLSAVGWFPINIKQRDGHTTKPWMGKMMKNRLIADAILTTQQKGSSTWCQEGFKEDFDNFGDFILPHFPNAFSLPSFELRSTIILEDPTQQLNQSNSKEMRQSNSSRELSCGDSKDKAEPKDPPSSSPPSSLVAIRVGIAWTSWGENPFCWGLTDRIFRWISGWGPWVFLLPGLEYLLGRLHRVFWF